MRTFTIESDNNITVFASQREAKPPAKPMAPSPSPRRKSWLHSPPRGLLAAWSRYGTV